MSEQRRKQIEQACEALSDASRRFAELATDDLLASVRTCRTALDSGGKLVLFGNGGSASQAQHLAAEFVTRLRHDRPAMAAMALTADAAVMTSIANDLGYERLFARQIESVGRAGDVAIAFSTSGHSPNVLAGLAKARSLGMATVSFLGDRGEMPAKVLDRSDHAICVPATDSATIQELHLLAGHLLCELLEPQRP